MASRRFLALATAIALCASPAIAAEKPAEGDALHVKLKI